MGLTKHEQETIILFNEAEQTAEIEVHSARLKRRLEQLCEDRPGEVRQTRIGEIENHYEFPKSWIKINPPRVLTEEQRERLTKIGFSRQ